MIFDWPSITGMAHSGGNLYVTYTPMNSKTFETAYTDTCFVAVYSYPEFKFVKLMKDTRMGPGGSWNAFNGFVKDEEDNLYVMSNSAISNGYSQSTKHAGFLENQEGSTTFDEDYFFDFEQADRWAKTCPYPIYRQWTRLCGSEYHHPSDRQ